MAHTYTTFSKGLDSLFGGYEPKVLIQCYGRTATSKTTICSYLPPISIMKSILDGGGKLTDDMKFFIIDDDGGFDVARFKQVAKERGLDPDEAEGHMILYNPTTFREQHEVVVKEIPERIKAEKIKPLFISLDPCCSIYRGQILRTPMRVRASVIGQMTGRLDLQFVTLRHLAVKYDIPACITSWSVSPVAEALGSVPETPALGGRLVGFLPKVIVELRTPKVGSPIREAILYKHRSRPAGGSVYFKLSNSGVEDVSIDELEKAEIIVRKLGKPVKRKRTGEEE